MLAILPMLSVKPRTIRFDGRYVAEKEVFVEQSVCGLASMYPASDWGNRALGTMCPEWWLEHRAFAEPHFKAVRMHGGEEVLARASNAVCLPGPDAISTDLPSARLRLTTVEPGQPARRLEP
jgi:hypothetical protein